MGLVFGPVALLGAYLVTYTLHGAASPAYSGLLHREASSRNRATILSMSSLAMQAGGAVAGPLQASSRSLLARLVPAQEAGRYFGLLALSGKVTSFLAPLAVAVATAVFQTQSAGPAVLILFLLTGFWLLSGVKRV